MSIKENLDYIKTEFSGDEKILENAFRLEIFYKRYKYVIWAIGVILIGALIVSFGHFYYTEYRAKKYSAVLNELLENPADEALRETLKNGNPKLYNLFALKEALEKGNVLALSELSGNKDLAGLLANYHFGSFERSAESLEKVDKHLLGDFAALQRAYALFEEGNESAASLALSAIAQDSALKDFANILTHYIEAGR